MRELEGVICFIDGILIYGNTQEKHDKCLLAVLNRLEKADVTSQQRQVQIFTERNEILRTHPFPGRSTLKIAAVVNMEEPVIMKELRCSLGMVNQVSNFMPHLAEMAKPLRDLLLKKNWWMWGHAQKVAFSNKRCPHQESTFSVIQS